MADRRLSERARAFEATGSVADEAALLGERLRQGSLSRPRLELAAHFGHAAAQALAPDVPPLAADVWRVHLNQPLGPRTPGYAERQSWCAWLRRYGALGEEALVRAGIAALRASLPAWDASFAHPFPREALAQAEARLHHGRAPWPPEVARDAAWSCFAHAREREEREGQGWEAGAARLMASLVLRRDPPQEDAASAVHELSWIQGPEAAAAVGAELVPWVLG